MGGVEVSLFGVCSEYDLEYLNNFEFVLRLNLFNGLVIFNVNVYYGKWID